MAKDKFTAIWVSHSSISDFLKCPRAYYLNNVYKDPKTGHKITLMQSALALGQAVHDVIESLSILPVEQRFNESLLVKFDSAWKKVSGKKGGFEDEEQESRYKKRGATMLRRIMEHPGPLKNRAVKIHKELPNYWLSEEDNLILCGKVDWLEYLPDKDSVHIIDFKTGKSEEKPNSLQLPIYHLLVHHCQKRKVEKSSFWYLERNNEITPVELPDLQKSHDDVLKIAKKIKVLRQLSHYKCPEDGCSACLPLEKIVRGEGEFVGVNEFSRRDTYILLRNIQEENTSSVL